MAQGTDNSTSTEQLQIRCESAFKQKLRVEAAKDGKSMSQFVRDTLRETWNGTSHPNKSIDTSGENTTQSGDYQESGKAKKSETIGKTKLFHPSKSHYNEDLSDRSNMTNNYVFEGDL